MKRSILLVLMLASVFAYGQKPIKPNLNKVLTLYQTGKLAEAKEMVDVATTYEKTMNEGKTYYYKGLIYASIDTTSNTAFKSLAQDPLKTAMEAFAKADQLGKPGTDYFTNDPTSLIPTTKTQQLEILANHYLSFGIKLIQQDEPDYKGCIDVMDKTRLVFEKNLKAYSNDTLTYFVQALAAQNAESFDRAIEAVDRYFEKGGNSKDVYTMLYQIYSGPKENKEKALEIVRDAKTKFPNDDTFAKLELGLLIDLNKIADAKEGLEAAIKKEPNNKIYHFYLGYVNSKLENWEVSKKNFEDALRIDPTYFDAQYYLAQIYFVDASKVKKEMDDLGISAADKKKKLELDKQLVEKYRIALPVWEKAEKLNPSDTDVLDKLSTIYYYLGEEAQEKRVAKRLKELGVEN